MSEEEKEAIEEFKRQLRLAMNIDDIATTIRNGYAQIILNLLEKLQKENEILKEEKAEAWEEWNILEQGSYETEQRLKSENEKLKALDLRNSKMIANMSTRHFQDREKIRNSIPIQKVKDIIDRIDYDIKKTKEIISNGRKNDYQIVRLRAMNTKSLDIKKRLQEMLEGRK